MGTTTAKRAGKIAIKVINSTVNFIVLTIILALVAIALYAIWDSEQVYQAADSKQYAIYKPSAEGSVSFSELQAINPDVFAWLTVYGTHIDYPITQGASNDKYVITDAYGSYSLSGSIFLDSFNNKNFQDFNSILYGHHMERYAMFGEIGSFSDKSYFDARAYGNLYYAGKDHGLEFFAFMHTNAYDSRIFTPRVQSEKSQQDYLNTIMEKSMYTRDIGVTTEDRLLLLSTCSSESTNGRDILFARITDQIYANNFIGEENGDTNKQSSVDRQFGILDRLPTWFWFVLPLILFAIAFIIFKKKRAKRE